MDKSKWKYNLEKNCVQEHQVIEKEGLYGAIITTRNIITTIPVSGKVSWADNEDVTGKFTIDKRLFPSGGLKMKTIAIPIQEQPHDKKLLKTLLAVNALIKEQPQSELAAKDEAVRVVSEYYPFDRDEKWYKHGIGLAERMFKSGVRWKENQSQEQPKLICSLDEQQCQQECEYKNNRSLCPRTKPSPLPLIDTNDKIIQHLLENDAINFLLANILRYLSPDQMKVLSDCLIERLPKTAPLIDKGQDAIEKLAEKSLVEFMKDTPVKVATWMLVQFGNEMVAANAETMEMKQEFDILESRYKMDAKFKLTKVKSLKNKNS